MSRASGLGTRLLKVIGLVLGSLVILVLAAALVFGLVARSERGTAWLVDTAVTHLVDDGQTGTVRGTLAQGLVVEDFSGSFGEVEVALERLEARLHWMALLRSRVHVNHLVLEHLEVDIPVGEDDPLQEQPPAEWPSLALPVEVLLERLQITDALIRMGDQEHRVHYAGLAAHLNPSRLEISELHLQYQDIEASLNGRIATRFPYASDLRFRWLLDAEEPWNGRGRLTGTAEAIDLEHRLTGLAVVDSLGTVTTGLLPHAIELDPEAVEVRLGNRVQVEDLQVEGLDDGINGALQVKLAGGIKQWHLEVDGTAATGDYPPLDLRLSGVGDLQHFVLESAQLDDGTGRLEVSGSAEWQPALRSELQVAIHTLDLSPWVPDADLLVDGRLAMEYQDEAGHPSVALDIQDLQVRYEEVDVAASGRLDWQPDQISVDGLQVSAADNHLQLSGHYAAGDIQASWNLDAPNLDALDDIVSGSIVSTGRLAGSLEQPRIDVMLQGRALQFADIVVEELSLNGQPEGRGLEHRIELTVAELSIGDTQIDRISALFSGSPEHHSLTADAVMADQSGELALSGGYLDDRWLGQLDSLQLEVTELGRWVTRGAANVELSPDTWVVESTCLWQQGWRERRNGPDRDGEPESQRQLDLESHEESREEAPPGDASPARETRRERGEPSRLCLELERRGEQDMQLQAELVRFPLHRFNHYWPIGTGIRGWLAGNAQISLTDDGPTWEASLTSSEGTLLYAPFDNEVETITYRDLQLSSRGDASRWQANGGFELPGQGEFAFGARVLPQENQRLEGRVTGRFNDLSWLELFANPVSDISGELQMDLDVRGTLDQPEMEGLVRLDGFAAYVAPLGINLADGRLEGRVTRAGLWNIDGGISTGEGRLRLQSTVDLSDPADWHAEFTAAGRRLLVIDTPEVRSLASPDISGNFTPERGIINGRVGLSETRIRIHELPAGQQTIVVSDDVVIHSAEEQEDGPRPYDLTANVEIVIDDEVDFEGYGLEARAEGRIALQYRTDRPLTAEGRVALTEGRYQAYGQDLAIERGEVYFSGPLDNPAIDIRAGRTARGMTAGIQLGGRVQSLSSSIYSDPPMPPSDAMAFLLTGRPLSGASQEEANMLVNAVASLGIEHGEVITGGIQSAFGLDTFALEGGDTVQDTALVVGKNLTPRLLISYSEKLFERTSTVTLSYELTRRTTLQAESGEGQSLDVIFRDEFGR